MMSRCLKTAGPVLALYASIMYSGEKEKPEAAYAILKSYVKSDAAILDLGSEQGFLPGSFTKMGLKMSLVLIAIC